jgi:hypothetical protein
MRWGIAGLAALTALSWASASVLDLCRYTVRDIGFVDLHGPAYTLEVAPQRPDRVSTDELAGLQKVAEHSNLRVRSAAKEDAAGKGQRGYVLKADHREGALLLDVTDASNGADVIRKVLQSPVQRILIEQALNTFAFLVVVESSNVERNQAIDVIAKAAQEQLQKLAPQLPRPIDHPVQVLRISSANRDAEKVLLWSMKLDDLALDQAALAVFYGRAKSIAPALRGENLTQRSLLSQLALIGQSCECDTDRDWAAEPSLPHAWSPEKQKSALEALGFQPDSPMVKSEVTRVLNQVGSKKRVGLREGEENANRIDNPLLGYGEFHVENDRAPASASQSGQEVSPPSSNPMLRTASAGEGDWGFEDDAPVASQEPVGELLAEPPVAVVDERSPRELANRISTSMILAAGLLALAIAGFILLGDRRG